MNSTRLQLLNGALTGPPRFRHIGKIGIIRSRISLLCLLRLVHLLRLFPLLSWTLFGGLRTARGLQVTERPISLLNFPPGKSFRPHLVKSLGIASTSLFHPFWIIGLILNSLWLVHFLRHSRFSLSGDFGRRFTLSGLAQGLKSLLLSEERAPPQTLFMDLVEGPLH